MTQLFAEDEILETFYEDESFEMFYAALTLAVHFKTDKIIVDFIKFNDELLSSKPIYNDYYDLHKSYYNHMKSYLRQYDNENSTLRDKFNITLDIVKKNQKNMISLLNA